jgi:hypothetical protein
VEERGKKRFCFLYELFFEVLTEKPFGDYIYIFFLEIHKKFYEASQQLAKKKKNKIE